MRLMKDEKRKKGFTLIELIIVIIIIAILAAIAIPAVSKYVSEANFAKAESNIGTLRRCFELALIDVDVLDANTDYNLITIPEKNSSSDSGIVAALEFQKEFEKIIGNKLIDKYKIVYQPDRPSTGSVPAIKSYMHIFYGPNGVKFDDSPIYQYDSTTGEIRLYRIGKI